MANKLLELKWPGQFLDVGGAVYNVSAFGVPTSRTTRAAAVQAAIDEALGFSAVRAVYVPAGFFDYDAAAVTFDPQVRMIREGGRPDVADVVAYGAAGDGVQDDSAAINAAIAQGPVGDSHTIWLPGGFDFRAASPIRVRQRLSILGPGIGLRRGEAGRHAARIFTDTGNLFEPPAGSTDGDDTMEVTLRGFLAESLPGGGHVIAMGGWSITRWKVEYCTLIQRNVDKHILLAEQERALIHARFHSLECRHAATNATLSPFSIVSDTRIQGLYFDDCEMRGLEAEPEDFAEAPYIAIGGSGASNNVSFRDLLFQLTGGGLIRVHRPGGVTLDNVNVSDSVPYKGPGVEFTGASGRATLKSCRLTLGTPATHPDLRAAEGISVVLDGCDIGHTQGLRRAVRMGTRIESPHALDTFLAPRPLHDFTQAVSEDGEIEVQFELAARAVAQVIVAYISNRTPQATHNLYMTAIVSAGNTGEPALVVETGAANKSSGNVGEISVVGGATPHTFVVSKAAGSSAGSGRISIVVLTGHEWGIIQGPTVIG